MNVAEHPTRHISESERRDRDKSESEKTCA